MASEFEATPIQVKVSRRQRAALVKAARRTGMPMGTWLRTVALVAAGEQALCDRNPAHLKLTEGTD